MAQTIVSLFKPSGCIVGVVLGCLAVSVAGVQPTAADATLSPGVTLPAAQLRSKVTPRLLAELDAGGESDVLVFVRGRPDLTPERALQTKEEKGQFVVEALRKTAQQTQAGARWLLDKRGVEYEVFWVVNMLRVRGDRALVAGLASLPRVRKLDINKGFRVLDLMPAARPALDLMDVATTTWGIQSIGAPAVWERGVRGQGIVVAGNDTGVDWDHEALIDAYRGWGGASADHSYNWHDAWDKTPSAPGDDHGHGTHTIGTAVGGGPNNIGVAPGAEWIACRNMNGGYGTPASYVDCFQFFLAPTDLSGENPRPDLAPDIINNSWACIEFEGCHPDDPLWDDTIRPAVEALTEAGIAVVVSAGNAGPGCGSVHDPPAIYAQSLTVGAVDSGNGIASFSSRGPVTVDGSGRPAPELAAPGVSVRSSLRDNQYGRMSGTSMAGPHVAGTIALLWSATPQLVSRLAVTEQILRASALPVANGACGGDSDGQPNNVYGWGVINADAAVQATETLQELRGTVTDAQGNSLAGAEITIADQAWAVEIGLLTGADGDYVTPVLPGSYEVEVNTPSHFSSAAMVTVSTGGARIHDVALLACADWDGDGRTGVFELTELAGDWGGEGFSLQHDVNGDGALDVVDVAFLAAHFDEPCSVTR
ncbi:MAG: Bacillopeptidase F [Anaerolineales bacterium]|nr:Bacillopeptidase F [Anaerolineales bacterium]